MNMEQVTSTSYALVPVATASGAPLPSRKRSGRAGLARAAAERYLQMQNAGGWARSKAMSWAITSGYSQPFAGTSEDKVSLSAQGQTATNQLAVTRPVQGYAKTHAGTTSSVQLSGHTQTQPTSAIIENPETRRVVRNAYGPAALRFAQSAPVPGSLLNVFA